MPDRFPCTGDCVLVPAKEEAVREGGDFMTKVRYGVYVGVDESIPEGGVVAVRDGIVTSFVHVSGPKKWSSSTLKRWRMHTHTADRDKVVWVSSQGDVVWTSPHVSTILSFEERRPGNTPADVAEYVRRGLPGFTAESQYNMYMHSYEVSEGDPAPQPLPGSLDLSWLEVAAYHANLVRESRAAHDAWVKAGTFLIRRHFTSRTGMFVPVEDEVCKRPSQSLAPGRITVMLGDGGKRHVVADSWTEKDPARPLFPDGRAWRGVTVFELVPEPDSVDNVVAQAMSACSADSNKDKYWLPSPAEEADMHRMEQVAENLESDALVNISVEPKDAFNAPEAERAEWEAGVSEELGNLDSMQVMTRVFPEDLQAMRRAGQKVPQPLPSKLVLVKKPVADSMPDANGACKAYKYKARICVCGNFQAESEKSLQNRSEVPDAFFTRCVLLLAVLRKFSLSILDVNAAFLYAWLPEDDPMILVTPPQWLKKLGLAKHSEVWLLRRALYGLRAAPKHWSSTRNDTLRNKEVVLPNNNRAIFKPADSQEHVWILLCPCDGIVAYALFYVDDILLAAKADVLVVLRDMVKSCWKVKDQGVLRNPSDETWCAQVATSCEEKLGLECHQIPYLRNCLKERGFGDDCRGSQSLPAIAEGRVPEFEDRQCEEYKQLLHRGQKEVGALLWASQRSRPDVAAVVGALGSLLVTHPQQVLEWCHQVWKYLAGTLGCKLVWTAEAAGLKRLEVSVSADASFAPGGSKSRTGVVAMVNGNLVQWSSVRQSLAAQSAVEAEIQAAGLGSVTSIALLNLLQVLVDVKIEVELLSDNTGCIANIMHSVTSWRDRHFCVRAAALRDQLNEHSISLKYRSGKLILADALTKVLGKQALLLARFALGIRDS